MKITTKRSIAEGTVINRLIFESGSLQLKTRNVASRRLIEIRGKLYLREILSLLNDAWWLTDEECSLLKETLKEKSSYWVDTNPYNYPHHHA